MKRHWKFILCAVVLVGSFVYGFSRNWYMSGLFLDQFRALPKDRQIVLLRTIGMRTSPLRVRDILLAAYPDQAPEQHELAHLIGETAYARFGSKGFDLCDSAFTFACFHGVIFGAIKKYGYDEAVLKGLSAECNASGKNDTAKVSCAHGIGHGIMWIKNYALVDSFQLCDRLFDDTKLRFFCWDGVSMENVVRRGDTAKALPLIPWKSDDIYFPCDSVPVQYQPACVREHVYLIRISLFNKDTRKSIDYCLHFPGSASRKECFGALGGALNQDDPSNPGRIVDECLKVPPPYDTDCVGTAAGHYAYAGDIGTAKSLCGAIVDKQAAAGCIDAVTMDAASLYVIQSP